MNTNPNLGEDVEITEETVSELTNGKGDDENEQFAACELCKIDF